MILSGTVLNNREKWVHNLKKKVNIFSILIDDEYGSTSKDENKRRYDGSTSILRFRCPEGWKPNFEEKTKVRIKITYV